VGEKGMGVGGRRDAGWRVDGLATCGYVRMKGAGGWLAAHLCTSTVWASAQQTVLEGTKRWSPSKRDKN
jgi:hypothetical protein